MWCAMRNKHNLQNVPELIRPDDHQANSPDTIPSEYSVREGLQEMLQNALMSFMEIVEHYPEELRSAANLSHTLEPTDDSGKTMGLREFALYLGQFIQDMPPEIFDTFVQHLSKCALVYRSQVERGQRRVILTNLFVACDNSGIGILDRHRVLALFENFYERAGAKTSVGLRNPRKWPVVEVDETESDYDDDEQKPKLIDNNVDVTEESKEKEKEKTDVDKPTEAKDEPVESKVQFGADVTIEISNVEPESADTEGKEEVKNAEVKSDDQIESKEEATESKDSPAESTDDAPKEEIKEDNQSETKEEVKGEAQTEAQSSDQSETKDQTEVKPEDQSQSKDDNQSNEETESVKSKQEKDKEVVGDTPSEQQNNEAADSPTEKDEKPAETETKEEDKVEDATKDIEKTKEEEDIAGELEDKGDLPLPKTPGKVDEPPRTQQTGRTSVSFAEGTTFEKERALLSTMESTRSQSQASAFDESSLNTSQFVQLTETFLGDLPEMESFNKLVQYVRNGYVETDEEKLLRLREARKEALAQKRKALLNSLFEMWDNDGSGLLEFDEVQIVMEKYKDGMELDAINKAKKKLRGRKGKSYDSRLTKREFRDYIEMVASEIPEEDSIDYLVEFLMSCVEKTYAERIRGDARKKWLKQIINAAETGGASMDSVYRAVFQSLYKDAETHGGGKKISANISILENNDVNPNRGPTLLRYVAVTPDDADILLGKCLYRDMKGVSFASVDSGKPIHVPRVSNHGGIHFWNHTRPAEEIDGSLLVVPLKDDHKRVFGLLGLDTLNDPQQKSIFITHEIQFFQGITKAFSIAYHYVDIRRKILRICESAVSWIIRRSPSVRNITIYMVEPDTKNKDYVLRRMMMSDEKGVAKLMENPPRLERKDNLFRDYLFKCVDNSETVMADAYGERHMAFPLRDSEGHALVSVDISIGDLKKLPAVENKEVLRMLKLLTQAYGELSKEAVKGEKNVVLEAERNEDNRVEILFDRLMLMDLRGNVAKLDARAYAELKSYKDPPKIVHNILKAVLAVFYSEKAESGDLDDWAKTKVYVTVDLSRKIMAYDPTTEDDRSVNVDKINEYLDEVPHNAVAKHGSIPAQYLYNWVFVCASLIEHTRKMADSKHAAALEVTNDQPKEINANQEANKEMMMIETEES
ncbi:unnamed protein product [Owenia fusiformis]|uniref:EF-hand domain-containing protein n=1 Tax=Owenia fusiformis TaxID=6347 RepID=A0A8S4Q4F8_OWEFU|nr:unnamed protein product [Owenia fusiformis]